MTYVAKGTPPGYGVDTVIDYLQSFNSGWPLLKVGMTGVYSGAVTHGLNYPPFFITTWSFVPGGPDVFSRQFGVNTTQLIRGAGSETPRYYIFRLDLSTSFTAAQISGSTTASVKNDNYVFKMTKEGKDISSTDMRDFSLHSGTRSPMVHMVRPGSMGVVSGGWGATVNHNLGYIPEVFVFIKPNSNAGGLISDRYYPVPPSVGVDIVSYSVTSSSVTVFADGAIFTSGIPEYSVVVLKQPFIKQAVNVSFP